MGQRPEVSPGYCVEWNSQTRRRRTLADGRDLRRSILAEEQPGLDRLFIIHSVEGRILETLRGVGGVDDGFLEAHVRRTGHRPREAVGARWWAWEFPEIRTRGDNGCGEDGISMCRASLWMSTCLSVLFINRPAGAPPPLRTPPRLRHQDAATRASALKTGGDPYGTVGGYGPGKTRPSDLPTEVYESLGGPASVEDTVGELVYDHWLSFLGPLGPKMCKSRRDEDPLWIALRALEQNQDTSRHLDKKGRSLGTPSHADWTDLISRVGRRINLVSPSLPAGVAVTGENDADRRSLDRISYLGGLMLPVTVVSGILAIESEYGPEGGKFWVFWAISVAASAVAVMIIYIDQVRALPVWIEVAADAMMEGDISEVPGTVVQRMADHDGERVRAWQRSELGWGGAVKKVSGYYRWRGSPGMQFEAPRI